MSDDAPTYIDEDGHDPLFTQSRQIFKRKELLRVGHVPDEDRIVGRSDEIEAVGDEIRPIVSGGPPNNVFLYGKTGSGKSLVAKHVMERAQREGRRNDVRIGTVYVDCAQTDTETRVAQYISRSLNPPDSSFSIPRQGIACSDYYEYLWTLIDDEYDAVLVILDEIDRMKSGEDDNLLYELSRAEEAEKVDDGYIGLIGVSNKLEYDDLLGERVKSSLGGKELIFHPYDATQLKAILWNREDAFQPDVLTDGVVELTAALAAQEHGDARKAIEILRHAGELARRANAGRVTEAHVREGKQKAEVDRFEKFLRGSPQHVKCILFSLAALTVENPTQSEFSTSTLYSHYTDVCDTIGMESLSEHRVWELLREQAFLGVVESTHTGGGKNKGSYLTHRLVKDIDIVFTAVAHNSDQLADLVAHVRE